VLLAYVVGAAGSGKSAILQHMVGEEWEERYKPTPGPRAVVAAVEQGGAEKYLVVSWVFCPSALRSRSTPR
jgi:Ras family protein T1